MGIGILALALIVVLYLNFEIVSPLLEKRRYLIMEMHRACSEHERHHWQKELRKLYLKSIPVVRWFIE